MTPRQPADHANESNLPDSRSPRFTRRRAAQLSGIALSSALLLPSEANAQATPAPAPLPDAIRNIIDDPRYRASHWGIFVADLQSGDVVYETNPDQWFLTASTAKLYAASAALDAYGPEYRFETPIYRVGEVDADGRLDGDLILVGSGDLTMGGRDTPDGRIAFTPIDHINAGAFPNLVTLTGEDPLAGIDDLARQVADSGITSVAGDVIIDDRLFPQMDKDTYVLSPVWINDNLIDVVVKPGVAGEDATVDWRPQASTYQVTATVQTVAAGEALDVQLASTSPGVIEVTGQIPTDVPQAVYIWQIDDPSAFARTVLIDALVRHGVAVAADPASGNNVTALPGGSYGADRQVALHRSLPFSENITLIMKTSHNQHADMLVFMLALHEGATDFDTGLLGIATFLQDAGLDPTAISLSDGRGNEYTDLVSPRAVTELLRAMATRPDFTVFRDALPIMGVDGTETGTVAQNSPVAGKAVAKSGLTVAGDGINQRPLVMARALAGYMVTGSDRDLVFAVYLNNLPIATVNDVLDVIVEHGKVVEAIYLLESPGEATPEV
ncbi:MAG: D-alanyl-D-alanine carboxypeptidase/D-alanyl-D-alanine-endopeptidase [Chloroflexota bacterium]|nr:D-alanyl-D-alanine carboxypeptidase/D-alanyl-D-alanine-endopeptidase [Chloroflexota bacterium]